MLKEVAANKDYYIRYASIIVLTGYHLMELDMIKISFPGFLEEFGVAEAGNNKKTLSEFSRQYSWQLYLGIPSTLLWGYISDKYGSLKTSVAHLLIHIAITVALATVTSYEAYFYLAVTLSFFSNYLISLSTFTSWLPDSKKNSYNNNSQFISSAMLQVAPLLSGVIVKFSSLIQQPLVFVYHLSLALLLSLLLSAYVYGFRNYTDEPVVAAAKQEESEDMKGVKGYITILKNKTATSLMLLGIYLRIVKKLVDVAVHLWAAIGEGEHGLGYDKTVLGTYSSIGGMISVVLYLKFAEESVGMLPQQLKLNLLINSVTMLLFPFLGIVHGVVRHAMFAILILSFNYCFSGLFAVWIGLINNGVKKEIKAKSFALTLALRSVFGTIITDATFGVLKWSLASKDVTAVLGGGLNTILFFWIFVAVNILMYFYFRNLKLEKKEKLYELSF